MDLRLRSTGFQSTRPSRGETQTAHAEVTQNDFNPLAPRGARRVLDQHLAALLIISIHSPLAGRDLRGIFPRRLRQFQSTRPSRGETSNGGVVVALLQISIHSPLAGRDVSPSALTV